jgi:hypothetical protein
MRIGTSHQCWYTLRLRKEASICDAFIIYLSRILLIDVILAE